MGTYNAAEQGYEQGYDQGYEPYYDPSMYNMAAMEYYPYEYGGQVNYSEPTPVSNGYYVRGVFYPYSEADSTADLFTPSPNLEVKSPSTPEQGTK